MIVDLNKYRWAIKPICRSFVEREPTASKEDLCARISLATNCHLVAVVHYMAELYGMTPELESFLGRLTSFYKIDSVIGDIIEAETT